MTTFPLFLFGLLFGSFANVCIWRVPRGESVVRPRSHCPSCGALITWRQNLPLLSYLFLKGRCASCRAPIPVQYPVVEVLCAALFLSQGMRFQSPAPLALGLALSFVLLVVSVIDLRHQIIPDVFSLGLLGLGLIASPVNVVLEGAWTARVCWSFLGAAAGFSIMFALAWSGERIFKKEALGGGDIKLMAAVGAFVGWKGVFATLFVGSLFGTLAAVILMAGRLMKRGDYLPFGPFLAAGAWSAWMGGDRLFRFFF